MVVHTPSKLEVLRQTAAQRRTELEGAGNVPPSVAAAAAAAAESESTSQTETATDGDLLGGLDAGDTLHDFAACNGDRPPPETVQAEVHAGDREERDNYEHANVTTRRNKNTVLTNDDQADKISVAGSVSDVTPPPNLGAGASGQHPPINPFTPEWFAQLVGAAASAAARAVATPAEASRPPPVDASAPRRLNDRKVPDFWEDKPEFWFRIFDAHLSHFSPPESRCFDALLPLLTSAARAVVTPIIRTPGRTPYSQAREALLRHFGRTPRQLAREMRDTRTLGDRLPSELLDHMFGLLPDVMALFEANLLDSLPDNARVAALRHTDVRSMARAADAVVLENRAAAESFRPAVSSVSLLDAALDTRCPPPLEPLVDVAAASAPRDRRQQGRQPGKLCSRHAQFGRDAYKCLDPRNCRLSNFTRPPPSAAAQGNGKAGGR